MKALSSFKNSEGKSRNRKILFNIVIFIATITLFVYFTSHLYIQAYFNKNYLNNITILEGKKLDSAATPDGDFLTGSDALAKAEVEVDDTLGNLYNLTMTNLKAQGYEGDGYTNTSSSNHDVYFKTSKGKKSIVLEYKFGSSIDCEISNNYKMFCDNQGYTTIETSGLKNMKINKIKVIYDND